MREEDGDCVVWRGVVWWNKATVDVNSCVILAPKANQEEEGDDDDDDHCTKQANKKVR